MKYISKELYIELLKLTMMYDVTNNVKGFELKRRGELKIIKILIFL